MSAAPSMMTGPDPDTPGAPDALAARVGRLLAEAPSPDVDGGIPFRAAQFEAGLAWVSFPVGHGGLGLPPGYQVVVDRLLRDAGVEPANLRNPIGYGNVAPVLAAYGTDQQRRRYLRACFTTEDIWCQLMSEPGAGSDVAGIATSARRDGTGWVLRGQKVWTSLAHVARWGLAVVRTDQEKPKHAGLTCFIVDMHAPGVEVRPLRMLNGKADFNEVFLDDVPVADENRVGEVGGGWQVVRSNLEGERAAFGAEGDEPDPGEDLLAWWVRACVDDPVLTDRVMAAVIRSRAARLTAERTRRGAAGGAVHPAIVKLLSSEAKQHTLEVALDAQGVAGTLYPPNGYALEQPVRVGIMQGGAAARYLRAQALTIEGGTSGVLRNVLADAVLGLPREPRFDTGIGWREICRGASQYERKVRGR